MASSFFDGNIETVTHPLTKYSMFLSDDRLFVAYGFVFQKSTYCFGYRGLERVWLGVPEAHTPRRCLGGVMVL